MDAFGPNASVQLKVILYIGPGPEETRQRLFEIAKANRPMSPQSPALHPKYNSIYRHKLIGHIDEDVRVDGLEHAWREFYASDLGRIDRVFSEQLPAA